MRVLLPPRSYLAVATVAGMLLASRATAGEPPPPPAALAGIIADRDVAYASGQRGPLTLDVYRPADARGPRPVLLFLHGGGWIQGSKHDALPEVYRVPSYPNRAWPSMLPYVKRGLALVTLDYRLAAEAPAPAAVEDCRRGLDWISTHGAQYGLDPSRVVTIGASAGGHLALMVAFTNGGRADTGSGRVIGAIDLYGITDVGALLGPPTERPWALQWIGKAPDREARARRMSPLSLVRAGVPPVLIAHSDVDAVVPFDQAQHLVRAMRDAGAAVELVTFPGAEHGFFTAAERARLEQAIVAFLTRIGALDQSGRD